MFEKMNGETPDLTKDNIDKLKQLFPEIVTDGKIDFEKLQVILGEEIDEGPDRYNFTWNGKKETIQFAQQSSKGTLRPIKEKSKNWDTTGNLYIEGDNLEVLKLMQKSYNNKVKMIYIDPPYNTGNDFIYKDNFKDNVNSYLELTGQKDEQGRTYTTNTESNGRYHTDWLNMVYPRLKLARNLLAYDGVIFISIDDNEVFNLKKVCDEIFGSNNYVAQLAVQLNPRGRNLDVFVAKTHESVLIYAKDYSQPSTIIGVEKEGRMVDEYNKEDETGKYRAIGLRNRNQAFNPQTRSNLYYPLYVNPITKKVSTAQNSDFCDEVWPDAPDGTKTCWTWMKKKVDAENDLIIAERSGNEWRIYRKDYLHKEDGIAKTLVKSLWTDNTINNDYGKKAIKELFDNNVMSFPKAPELIKKMLQIGTRHNSIVMDFFSGSSTTAQATMQLNAEDGGNRKFIMVQLPEILDEKSEAYQDGYRTICDIGEERIRRAGEKVKNDLIEKNNKEGLLSENQVSPDDLDIGLKVFSLDNSNLMEWQADFDKLESNIDLFESNFLNDRSELDVLFEIMLKNGLDLTYPVNEISEGNHKIYDVAAGNLFVCLNDNINRDVARKIATLRKEYGIETSQVVFKDSGFENDTEKLNCYEILKEAGFQDSDLLSI